jgi:hypothetical protein
MVKNVPKGVENVSRFVLLQKTDHVVLKGDGWRPGQKTTAVAVLTGGEATKNRNRASKERVAENIKPL